MLLITAIGNFFVACSSSDDDGEGDDTVSSSIVGTWEMKEDDLTLQITFKETGEGELTLKEEDDITVETFYFNYFPKENELIIANSKILDGFYFDVVCSKTKLFLDYNNEFKRISGASGTAKTISGNLIGTWETTSEDNTICRITFKSDGNGEEYYKSDLATTRNFSFAIYKEDHELAIRGSLVFLQDSDYEYVVTSEKLFLDEYEFTRK